MRAWQRSKRYTYEDYLSWDSDERYELIDGVPYLLAAPSVEHNMISKRLYDKFNRFLADKLCEIYYAPFAVRLNVGDSDDTVVEPDLFVSMCQRMTSIHFLFINARTWLL